MKDYSKQLKVVEVGQDTVNDINTMDNTFVVRAKVIPDIRESIFNYSFEEIPVPYTRFEPNDKRDYATYIQNPDKTVFLAYTNHKAIGQIILTRWWNKFAYVEDIRVDSRYRRKGIGKELMDAAVSWARNNGYPGIMLETQNTNVPACLFYEKYGFVFGGVDKVLYHNAENSHEMALFWYFIL
jgi:ribosomal protein S18 acetylase RimI-like enzyme